MEKKHKYWRFANAISYFTEVKNSKKKINDQINKPCLDWIF